MHPAIVLGVASVIAVGGGAAIAYEFGLVDSFVGMGSVGNCADKPLVSPVGEKDARIAFQIVNEEDAGAVHLCLVDETGSKRWDYQGQVPAGRTTTIVAEVPASTYYPVIGITGPGDSSAVIQGQANVANCADHEWVERATASFGFSSISLHSGPSGCGDIPDNVTKASLGEPDDLIPVDGGGANGAAGGIVAAAFTLSGLGALLLWQRHEFKFLAAALFTRLQRPTLLDQGVRNRIYELVQNEPGIHGSAIAQRLELGNGQTVHHLRILVRERLLSRVNVFGAGHYFPTGKYAPDQMRLLAALTHRPATRLYHAILAQPGQSLTEVSRYSGLSLGRASRLAQRLADAGLVARREEGRTIRLTPVAQRGQATQ